MRHKIHPQVQLPWESRGERREKCHAPSKGMTDGHGHENRERYSAVVKEMKRKERERTYSDHKCGMQHMKRPKGEDTKVIIPVLIEIK